MARASRKTQRGIGAALAVVGGGLVVWGYRDSQTVGERLTSALTGDPSNDVLLFYILGAAGLVAGLVLLFRN